MSIIAGVLWLNTSLTVGAHKAGSHKGHWEEFTDKVLKEAVRESKGVVVMAWGAWAQKRAASLDKVSVIHTFAIHISVEANFLWNDCAEETFDFVQCRKICSSLFELFDTRLTRMCYHSIRHPCQRIEGS